MILKIYQQLDRKVVADLKVNDVMRQIELSHAQR